MQRADDRTTLADDEDLDLPDELIQGLARLDKAVAVMSPDADRRIAEAARVHFGERPRRARSAGRRWAMAGSLAASVLVASVLVGVLFWRTQTPVEDLRVASVASVANDIDGSGVVDILDAFALARMQAADRTPVAQAEIDALSMRIVALDGSPEKL